VTDLDVEALHAWLRDNVEGVGDGPVAHDVISGGASNLTIGVTVGQRELVVRRPPVGAFLPSANDVSREYRYLRALRETDVPVPPALALCDDPSVIGAPFYVMERLHGIVPHDPAAVAHLTPAQARALSERFIEVLKAIHAVDVDAVGLGDAAKRSGYLERQVGRWTDQWHRSKFEDAPVVEELSERLRRSLPAPAPTTIVHGDYRLGNVMVGDGTAAHDPAEIVGVFDWEMATLGDPRADLGYALLWWGTADRPPFNPSQAVADLPGFLTPEAAVSAYGEDPDAVTWFIVLAAFKLTIIGEGNRARLRRTGGEVPAEYHGAGLPLADWALDLLLLTKG